MNRPVRETGSGTRALRAIAAGIPVLAISAAARAVVFTSAGTATTTVFSGNSQSAPTGTWNRPAIGVTPPVLSTVGTTLPYVASPFSAPVSDTYTFSLQPASSNFDAVAFLYRQPFSAALPLVNIAVPGVTRSFPPPASTPIVFRVPLSAGAYTFVTTGFENAPLSPLTNSGAFTVTATYGLPVFNIPDFDPAGVSTSLNVPVTTANFGVVTGINSIVVRGLLHPYASDLTFTLSKGAVSFTFLAQAGGSAAYNGANYTFTASGNALPTTGVIPSGTYTGQSGFSAFNGVPAGGNWTLRAVDSRGDDVGSFTGFSLDLATAASSTSTWITDADAPYGNATNWSTGSAPGGDGSVAVFGNGISAARVVTLPADTTVGALTFSSTNRYTLAGPGRLTFRGTLGGPATVSVTAGSHTILAPVTVGSDTTVSLASGSTLTLARAASSTNAVVSVVGPGTLAVTDLLNVGALSIAPAGAGYNGFVDLGTATAVFTKTTVSAVRSLVAAWYNNRSGTLQGLGSTAVTPLTTLAIFPNGVLGGTPFYSSIGGVNLSATYIIVRRAYIGDTNLDGVVNGTDLANLIEGLSTPGASSWAQGDLNYDGQVTLADLALFNGVFPQATPLEVTPPLISGAVPEPASLALIAPGTLLLARRRASRE